uniref:Uncharacterized protein n=1 Tax=Ditylenchus dipsaci TaxID=166011 RepID=A0A915EG43_9BILA
MGANEAGSASVGASDDLRQLNHVGTPEPPGRGPSHLSEPKWCTLDGAYLATALISISIWTMKLFSLLLEKSWLEHQKKT